MGELSNEGVLDSNGVIGCLGNNIRALDGGIGMNSVFPSKLDRGEVVGLTEPLKRGPSFGNRSSMEHALVSLS